MKRALTTLLLSGSLLSLMAQTDLGVWTNASATMSVGKKWEVEAGAELRTAQGLSSISRYILSGSVEYAPLKMLSVGVGYLMLDDHTEASTTSKGYRVDEYWQLKHRLLGQMKLKVKAQNWRMNLRLRYQNTHESRVSVARYDTDGSRLSNKVKEAATEQIFRTKLTVAYKTKVRLSPFVSYELSNDLQNSLKLTRQRLEVGTGIALSKHNTLTLSYKHNFYADDSDTKTHNVVGVAYNFEF